MITRADNFVVVRHVADGPLMKWILQSGLIHEEVALVQPAYQPASHYEGTLGAIAFTPSTLERDGVRFSNFTFSAVQFGTPSYDTNQSYLITDLTDIMPNPRFWEPSGYFVPSGTNFLALHGELGKTNVGTVAYTEEGVPYFDNSLLWKLGFDVTVTAPNKAISPKQLGNDQSRQLTDASPNGSCTASRAFRPVTRKPLRI